MKTINMNGGALMQIVLLLTLVGIRSNFRVSVSLCFAVGRNTEKNNATNSYYLLGNNT